jgi:predicted transcriptional regulator
MMNKIHRQIRQIMESNLSVEKKDELLWWLDEKSRILPHAEKMLVETIIHRKRLSLRETL